MKKLTFYSVENAQGQALLERYVSPLCAHLGITLEVAPAGINRSHALARQLISDILLWDGSVETGHVYHAMSDWVKQSKKHVIISRTPLPRNVLALNQCAPIHGEQFENDVLNEWLEQWLSRYLASDSDKKRPEPPYSLYTKKKLAEYYWLFDHPADIFLSLRGSQLKQAEEWSRRFTAETGQRVRIVSQQQYAYETECVTRQQMWEVIACLYREIRATDRRVIFLSNDYFNSFWTCSELFSILRWPRNKDGRSINGAYFVSEKFSTKLHQLEIGTQTWNLPSPTKAQNDRFRQILVNSDPMSSAPDTQIPPSSFAKALVPLLRPLGYFKPDFTGPDFWQMVRVPCPHCRPKNRLPEQIDWEAHLRFDLGDSIDYHGYFAVLPEQLKIGRVTCPQCLKNIKIKNVRSPRTLWIPLMTTEKDQTRPIIVEQPLWEVSDL